MMATALKYPGKFPDARLEEWFAEATKNSGHVNPCVRLYGLAETAARCKECRLLLRTGSSRKTYFKCELRGITRGPGTDHRANWLACGRFVRAEILTTDGHG